MKYLLLLMAAVLTALGLGVGCTKKSATSGNSSSSLNPGQIYQSPSITGTLKNGSSVVMSISNLTGANFTGGSVPAPATLTLDLSGSTAPSGTAVSAVVTSSNGLVTSLGSLKFSVLFQNPVLGSVKVVLSDALGLQSQITFNVPVTCDPNILVAHPIAFPANPIHVTKGSAAGYVNIAVDAATGGSGSGFVYAIDINGDGRYDDYNQQFWNSSPSWSKVYDLYNGSRSVKILAMDTQCQFTQSVTQSINYLNILDPIQSGATAAVAGYYYVQGNVATNSGSSDAADNVTPYDAMDDGGGGSHVRCSYDYNSGSGHLGISSYNTYSDGNTNSAVEASLLQGLKFDFPVSSDTGGLGTVNQSGIAISSISYQTPQSPDGNFAGTVYNKSSGATCTASVAITKTPSQGTCASMPNQQLLMIQMLGTYSCSSLSGGSKSVKINNGYFYCQYDTSDNCVGGGQEGGNPPPPF